MGWKEQSPDGEPEDPFADKSNPPTMHLEVTPNKVSQEFVSNYQ